MGKLQILGLGAGDLAQMPLGFYRELKKEQPLFVRTADHPALAELGEEGVTFTSFDQVYERHEQFEDVYEEITDTLLKEAQAQNVVYAVPGHPFVAERTVQLLMQRATAASVELEVLGGSSFLDGMYTALAIDPVEGCQIVDGTALRKDELELTHHIIIVQVYDAMIASEVKLTLMERLPDDYEVVVATAVGSSSQSLTRVPLFELDRVTTVNNLTAIYVPPVKEEVLLQREFSTLRSVIATLRGPGGCPWDQKQTHESLKKYLLEEAYEMLEAIDEQDDDHLAEELGDVLLQVMLHAQIGEDEGMFAIEDVIQKLTEKMIRRHPHVFATSQVEDAEEVVSNWQQIKQQEKGLDGDQPQPVLADIPTSLPGLMLAEALQKKAAKVGFDWTESAPIWAKLQEEIGEFLVEANAGNRAEMEKEFGDILFVAANLARFYKVDAEVALQTSNAKFKRRFTYMEEQLLTSGKTVQEATLEEMDSLWEAAKRSEKEE
ncbi:nucleoside triphosphate pyrophosphohydrolase [Shouchella shacheensis]|uniref:nucleoside triphosphate pyrophosphohydrolase n=1 Tax=Shouchella shacheensis TaxID=1649580 RepID=UPI00073FA94B|nr:nucleoside triphosphate pyrophosphohydrolase [Shouchella shacheensis]